MSSQKTEKKAKRTKEFYLKTGRNYLIIGAIFFPFLFILESNVLVAPVTVAFVIFIISGLSLLVQGLIRKS